ncbi:Gyc88E [Scenedesmus sp. PABB004]|nr:Gyc88E [Scenedesmus sp. PABB004]
MALHSAARGLLLACLAWAGLVLGLGIAISGAAPPWLLALPRSAAGGWAAAAAVSWLAGECAARLYAPARPRKQGRSPRPRAEAAAAAAPGTPGGAAAPGAAAAPRGPRGSAGGAAAGGAAGAAAAAAAAAGLPSLGVQRLRRFSLRKSAPRQAYSEAPAHCGVALVLCVNASPIDQAVVSALLGGEASLSLAFAGSGQAALDAVLCGAWLPDVLLMDVALPDMRSSEVTAALRAVYSPAELPIVLMSSRSGEADMLAALEGGVNDFLIKPMRRTELLARINSQLMIRASVKREAESRSHYELLVRILPPHVIRRLGAGETCLSDTHDEVTILFSDIVGFTELCSEWPTRDVVEMLDALFTAFDDLCETRGVFKVETIGDCFMAVCGHDGCADHSLRMAALAVDMLAAAEGVQRALLASGRGGPRVAVRVGLHTGPAMSGVVGKNRPRFCFFGDAINTASRMESYGFPMTVHVSDACAASMRAGAGSGELPWELLDLGERYIKGKGVMRTHLLRAGEWLPALCAHRMRQEAGAPTHDSSTCSTNSPVAAAAVGFPAGTGEQRLTLAQAFDSQDDSQDDEEARLLGLCSGGVLTPPPSPGARVSACGGPGACGGRAEDSALFFSRPP